MTAPLSQEMLAQEMLATADIVAVSQLVLTERESRDLGRWSTMRACFHPDSRIRLSWIDGNGEQFVEGSIDMAKRGMLAKHRLGPPLVRLNGKRAVASLSAIIDIPDRLDGVDVQLSSYARFMYRAEKRDGRWRINFFDSIYVRDELNPVIPGQTISIPPDALKAYRTTYRFLSYLLSLKNYKVRMDLAGDDRPETVEAMHKEIFGWAGIEP